MMRRTLRDAAASLISGAYFVFVRNCDPFIKGIKFG